MGKRGERKILEIAWNREGVEIKVPVKMVTKEDRETGKDAVTFLAQYPEAGVDVWGTDINAVREEVFKKLDEWYTVEWDLYFLVTVSGGKRGHCDRFEVVYEYEFYVIGKDIRGNTRHMRIPRPDKIEDFEKKKKITRWSGVQPCEGMPEVGGKIADKWSYGGVRTSALVKATPENVAAADRFMAALQELLEKMHHYFAPENVDRLLGHLTNLLPASTKKSD